MKEFLIEYGMRDGVLIKDVVLAETAEQAQQEADRQAEDLWESNKIATAKPFGDKHGQPADNTFSSSGALPDVHAAGRGSSGGSVTP